jgi:hypothetical protein
MNTESKEALLVVKENKKWFPESREREGNPLAS